MFDEKSVSSNIRNNKDTTSLEYIEGGSDSKESAFSASFNVYVMYFLTRLYASLSLFNLNAKYIMGNAGLDESQAGIKTVRRNINTLDIQMIPF